MKKVSLLIGALGGGMAGYLFSNKKLRDQLSKAKDAEAAALLLGKHLQKDGKKLAKQVQEYLASEDVQQNIAKAKKVAQDTFDEAKDELQKAIGNQTGKAKGAVKRAASKGKTAAKKAAKKGKAAAKKTAKKGVKKAKKAAKGAARRVKTKVRKVS